MYKNLYKRIKYNFKSALNKGLTLIELMVVIAIFLGITSTVLFNYGDFSSNVSLQNLTDDIALSIRKAQGFAIGARGISDGTGTVDFNKSYGMHFSVNPTSSNLDSSERAFLMFSIPTPQSILDKFYSVGSGSCGDKNNNNCVEFFNIMTLDKIKGINVINSSGPISLGQNASVDVVFTRPDPRAYICYRENSNPSTKCAGGISRVEITISNGQTGVKEKFKKISVQNTGQISIEN